MAGLDLGKALTFMFEEPDWQKKFLIGVAVMLASIPLIFLGGIPALIPVFLTTGYAMEISRRRARNEAILLPEWSEWGTYLKDGAKVGLAGFIYTLPFLILMLCFIASIVASEGDPDGAMSGFAALFGFCVACFSIIGIIPLYIGLYGGTIEYLRTGEFSSFFRFRNFSALKSDSKGSPRRNFIIIVLIIVFPLGMVGGIIPLLGTVWALFAQGHLIGQVLQETGYESPTNPAPSMTETW